MAPAPVTWIFDKADYSKHRVVKLPDDPLPALGPSSLRLQTKLVGLTTSNQTYARLGHILPWWDVYPPPENAPAPYNDRETHCRIAGWGYAEIVESTVPDIPVGNMVFGYLAISTVPFDLRVEHTGLKDQIVALNEHRQHLWKIYNRYRIYPPLAEFEKNKQLDFLGWDCLMEILFGTSYNLNLYGFAWKDEYRIHPAGEGEWTAEDANLDNSTVILLNASGKTGMSFAYALRNNRPKEHQPKTVMGVGSPASKSMLENSGFYEKVVLNSEAGSAADFVEKSGSRRTIVLDFGSRTGTPDAWKSAFASSSTRFDFFSVGGEVKVMSPEEALQAFMKRAGSLVVNANVLREKGVEIAGEKYFEMFYKDWDEFKRRGGVPGCRLVWGKGVEGWAEGWEALCKDKGNATDGLVYRF
ncbi:hypothetical protein BU26DRAFT_584846 [Trematosphaeria pertusa]|uniref:Uncharacterized protein n=1 Tax=Trematosphaeria pertusa TaxID=390896 RepID=A0A6A6HX80_9PLEO|nr:uncharacterized protein BU26DRAFT_584846 [Trematosphaeria pertusa]KAF2241980.1 hypothetical protein BU26DRAFT_584846 [Trematosphaeria pertusa]